jgi:hypothetical protein
MIVLNSASVRREAVCVSDCNAGAGSHCPIRVQVELADHVDVVGIDEIGNGCFRRTQTRAINAAPLLRVTICRELRHCDQKLSPNTLGQIDAENMRDPRLGINLDSRARTPPACPAYPGGQLLRANVVSGITTKTYLTRRLRCHQPPRDRTFLSDPYVQLGTDRSTAPVSRVRPLGTATSS